MTITKLDIGLDKVNNFDIATLEESINPLINDKYLTPATVAYILAREKALANPPIVTPPSVPPIPSIIPNTSGNSSGTIKASFESLIDKGSLPKTTIVGTNSLVSVEPSNVTNQLTFAFKATNTNTGPVTFTKSNITLPIVNYNNTPLSEGVIIKDRDYVLMYKDNSYILINPSDPFDVVYVDGVINLHKQANDGHPLVTITTAGFMSAEDKVILNSVSTALAGLDTSILADVADLKLSKINSSLLAIPNGIATLDNSGKLSVSQIPSSLLGGLIYQGTWNALNNYPVITSSFGVAGHYYKVSTEGSALIDTISTWKLGDTIVFNGTTWDKIDGGSSEVYSINGLNGDVTINKSTIGLSNVDNTSDINKPISTAQSTELNIITNRLDSLNLLNVNFLNVYNETLG